MSNEIVKNIEQKNIKTEYVNKYYINDEQIKERSELIEVTISNDIDINYDFEPITYYLQLKQWLSLFKLNYLIIALLIFIPVLVVIFRMNYINTGLFVTGFSATSIEIILIIAFQVIYGYLYQMIGIIITFFMVGMATGVFI